MSFILKNCLPVASGALFTFDQFKVVTVKKKVFIRKLFTFKCGSLNKRLLIKATKTTKELRELKHFQYSKRRYLTHY